ncbi:MAG: NAD-dependent decaprenylphosphoryl-D-2-keto erythropentose reductase [Chlamydiae bacterium]|nr:NAD-dependent decaprenylphosphoryl-D-2-keto erythropentose reductase [Chlamydiota bacterium]
MSDAVLVLGATSAIARAAASAFAEKGHSLYLAGRDTDELQRIASDLEIRHQVEVKFGQFDAEKYREHSQFLQRAVREMDGLEGVLVAFGDVGHHQKAMEDFEEEEKIINRNFTGACSIIHQCANYFSKKRSGFIIGISSVAGDRGRQSNYIYGSAKGAFALYLQGLRNRLYPQGVRVLTIKPGFVDTPMTFGKPGLFLVASPEYVGRKIVKALSKSSDVVYLPGFWRYIMMVINSIPECIFKRLKL